MTAKMKKPTVEYRWEAFYPATADYATESVFRRGPIRNDLAKVAKYAVEIEDEITGLEGKTIEETARLYPQAGPRHLSPDWRGAKVRILTRTISPWTEVDEK